MVRQNPGTTVHNLIVAGRQLKVGQSINPPELVQGSRAARAGLTPEGGTRAESINPVIPFQTIDWWLPGVVAIGTNVGAELRMPQLAKPIRLYASCKGALSGDTFVADLYSNGSFFDNVAIQDGTDEGFSDLSGEIPAFARLHINIVDDAGADDVTISLIYQPTYEQV